MKKQIFIFLFVIFECVAVTKQTPTVLSAVDQVLNSALGNFGQSLAAAASTLTDKDVQDLIYALNSLKNITTNQMAKIALTDTTVVTNKTNEFISMIGIKFSSAALSLFSKIVESAFLVEQAQMTAQKQTKSPTTFTWSYVGQSFLDRILCMIGG